MSSCIGAILLTSRQPTTVAIRSFTHGKLRRRDFRCGGLQGQNPAVAAKQAFANPFRRGLCRAAVAGKAAPPQTATWRSVENLTPLKHVGNGASLLSAKWGGYCDDTPGVTLVQDRRRDRWQPDRRRWRDSRAAKSSCTRCCRPLAPSVRPPCRGFGQRRRDSGRKDP